MVLAYQEADDKGRAKSKLEVFEKHLKEEGLEIETALKTVNDNTPIISFYGLGDQYSSEHCSDLIYTNVWLQEIFYCNHLINLYNGRLVFMKPL